MRVFIATRSMVAENELTAAVVRVDDPVQQIVVLGAGLDTLALRNPFPRCACSRSIIRPRSNGSLITSARPGFVRRQRMLCPMRLRMRSPR
jgi:hypothetical protein